MNRIYRKTLGSHVTSMCIESASGVSGVVVTPDLLTLPMVTLGIPDTVSEYELTNIDQHMVDCGYELVV